MPPPDKATVRGAEGEIPYRLEPGGWYMYADLSGPDGAFATLDYSEDPPPAASFFCCFSRASLSKALRERRILLPSIERTFTRT